jgi:hypothetical protein
MWMLDKYHRGIIDGGEHYEIFSFALEAFGCSYGDTGPLGAIHASLPGIAP